MVARRSLTTDVDVLGKEWALAWAQAQEAKAHLDEASARFMKAMRANGIEEWENEYVKVCIVTQNEEQVDVESLRALVSRVVYNKVTVTKVDLEKWRAAVKLGTIPESVVEAVRSFKPKASYLSPTWRTKAEPVVR